MGDSSKTLSDQCERKDEGVDSSVTADTENTQTPLKHGVIIIGAGLTGLLIAHGLTKTGIPSSIWESEANFQDQRSGDWSMGIHWALPQLEALLSPEVYAKMQKCHTDPFHEVSDDDYSQVPFIHGVTGEILKPTSKMKMPRMSRYRTRQYLASALPEGSSVQCGKRLLEIESNVDTVTAKFAHGTKVTGTCLIGCDGPRSRVRQILVGTEKGMPSSVPYIATRILVSYPTAAQALHVRSAHYLNAMAFHPDGIWAWISVIDIPNPSMPETWKFQLMTSWRKPSSSEEEDENKVISLDDVKSKYKSFAEPFRSAHAWIPDGTPVYANRVTYWDPIPWANHGGKISLAGDAAHPMTFHRGQALNHALLDAASYIAVLQAVVKSKSKSSQDHQQQQQQTLEDAIGGYEREMISRGGEEVRLSKVNTEMVHDWERLVESPLFRMGVRRGGEGEGKGVR